MMIDAVCNQTSHLLPVLTKMKRNVESDNDDELTSISLVGNRLIPNDKLLSPRKILKFGVDTILGNVHTHSDNDSSFEIGNNSHDELRHKGKLYFN